MKTFIFHGPNGGVTLRETGKDGAITEREVVFHDGTPVELPEDHPYVKTLAALGHLEEAPPAAPILLPAAGATTEAQ